jgi:glycosyltransferase involved in cell wall biosynthesis
MRILHINDIANVGATLVDGLVRLGHDAELRRLRLVAKRRSTLVKLLASPARLHEWLDVNRQVSSGGYDVVHIHFAYQGWIGILGRYPYFLHCHGSDVRRDLHDRLRRWPIVTSLRRARAVLFATPDLAPIVSPIRPDAIFLPDPVNTDRFAPNHTLAERRPRILIGSSLYPIKRVDIAFEAIRTLLARHPDVQVTAIDQGPERQRYYGTPGVTFVPPVPYQEMPALIQAHDLVVGQFGLGILSMVELESMACGKPVVCHFNYGDWYPELPPVLSTNQPAQAADYLSELIEDPALRRQSGERGRAWVEEQHGYLTIAQRLEQIYRADLASARPTKERP